MAEMLKREIVTDPEIEHVSAENGNWTEVLHQWEDDCTSYGESFDEYATATLPVLRDLAEQPRQATAGVYALKRDEDFQALSQLNVGRLPDYTDKVLRVRHILLAPRFDFGEDLKIDDYQQLLVNMFLGVLKISDREMKAPNVKFHFRSPAERQFFSAFQSALKDKGYFEVIELRGSWLYIKKKDRS